MAKKYHNFQPQQTLRNAASIGGKCAFVAARGAVVVPKTDGSNELVLATGKAGLFLMRDVKSAADITAIVKANEVPTCGPFGNEFELPYQQNGYGQAREERFVWVEGDDLISDLDENTAVGTKVTTASGKIAAMTDSETEECLGIVRAIEAAKNSDAPAKRFLIEVIPSTVNIPAA